MGVAAGDYDADSWLDIFRPISLTNTSSLPQQTDGAFDDATLPAGLGGSTSFVSWALGSLILIMMAGRPVWVSGHIFPEVER